MRRLFLDHLVLKAFSIVIGILAWVIIVGQQTIQETVEVSLNVLEPRKPGLVIASDPPKVVKATVKGARVKLRGIHKGVYRTTIDMREAEQGSTMVLIPIQNLQFPAGVEVQRLTPPGINITVDAVGERKVPVEVRLEGDPEEGFVVAGTSVEPKEVRVVGPRSVLRNLKSIPTKAVSVAHRTGNYSVETGVEPPSEKIKCDASVRVDVTIEEVIEVRDIADVKLKFVDETAGGERRNVVLKPDVVTVKVKGPRNDLEALKASDIEGIVKIEGAVPVGKVKVRPQFKVPPNMWVQGSEPVYVSVIFQ